MNRSITTYLAFLGVLVGTLAATPLARALELPAVFADHMVLQRDMPVPVWGKAAPEAKVTVVFHNAQAHTQADAEGAWRVDLPAMAASAEPRDLHVTEQIEDGVETQVFADILVGDVWHCSGQSNMGWTVSRSNDAEAEIAAADYPLIRHFTVPRTDSDTPQFTSGGSWQAVSPDTIGAFSAVGYYFGRKIHQSQDVPIGLVATPWGGASAEAFTSMPTLLADPFTALHIKAMAARSPDDPKFRKQHTPAAIYHGMIHPIAPFAHRGVLWYQGESNANYDRAVAYRDLLSRMIEDWRQLWDQPGEHRDTPFLIVQLANFKQPTEQPPATNNWGELRDSQAHVAAAVPNTYLATAIDIGDAKDIHPKNKQDVGLRLARLAEHHVYGDEDVVPVGPTMIGLDVAAGETSDTTVVFENAAGLKTLDGLPPRGFAIRVDDSSPWVWADAEIVAESVAAIEAGRGHYAEVKLTHPDLKSTEVAFQIRYAYGINPAEGPQGINLVNGEGLPAMPFRTDPMPNAE